MAGIWVWATFSEDFEKSHPVTLEEEAFNEVWLIKLNFDSWIPKCGAWKFILSL